MKPMHSLSTQQHFTLNQLKYASLDNRYTKRHPNQKLLTQQSLCTSSPSRNTRTIAPVLTKNHSQMQDVTRSEQLINIHSDFKDQMQRQNSIFRNKWASNDNEISIKNLKETSNDMLAKRSVQILIGIQKGANKTQYSKINRRKEEIFKKSTISQKEEKKELPIHKFEDFSQQKILQKYRQMILRKEQGARSFNMINKLYQIEALSSKEVVRSHKDAMKVIPTKSYQTRKNSQIQYKISKIIHKPAEIKVVKEMLAFQYDSHGKQSFRQDTTSISHKKPQPQQLKKDIASSVVTIKKQLLKDKIEPATPKISQVRIRASTNHKIEAVNTIKKTPSPFRQQIKVQIKQQQKQEVKNQPQILHPPPKKVTATAYIIYEILENQKARSPTKKTEFESIRKKDYPGKIHHALNFKNASEIASLTKIMTCIIVIEVCQRLQINTHEQKYKVGYFESSIKGTSAEIQVGDIYTIDQLLKGLMLPSGNDASLALARWTGNILLHVDPSITKGKMQNTIQGDPEPWATNNKYLRYKSQKLKPKRCYNRFIAEMNKKARLLGLQRTVYMNSHGLSDPHNKSCCIDMAVLCEYAIQNPYFCEIVSCKECKATIDKEEVIMNSPKAKKGRLTRRKINREDPEQDNIDYQMDTEDVWNKSDQEDNDEDESDCENLTMATKSPSRQEKIVEMTKKQIHWINTHKLLQNKEGYFGIKTGVTVTAGPCLASYYKVQNRKFIIIVLNSKKLTQRFVDTEILRHWLCKKEQLNQGQSKLSTYQITAE